MPLRESALITPMENSTQSDSDGSTAAKAITAAGEWLVSLCTNKDNFSDPPNPQSFTALEQSKFNEFFVLYQKSPVFKPYHAEAVRTCLSDSGYRPDYRLTRALLDKDGTKSLLSSENDVLQVAIKAAQYQEHRSDRSPKGTCGELISVVELLIDHGASVNCLDSNGNSAMFYACILGYEELFRFLLAAGAELSTEYQRLPLPWHGDRTIVGEAKVNLLKITLEALISPRKYMNYQKDDVDMWQRDLESNWGGIILHLLQEGLSYTKEDPELATLLHIACYQGASGFARKLLDLGVATDVAGARRVNERGSEVGRSFGTALHAAAANCQLSIVKMLTEHGENPNTRRCCILSYHGKDEDVTPVELAIASHVDIEGILAFLEGLMKYGDDLKESDYHTMINFAAKNCQLDFTKRLLQRGVKPPVVPADVSSLDMAQLLVSYDAFLDPVAVQSSAVERGQLDLLRWCVCKYGPKLPPDPESWGKVAFQVLTSIPCDLDTMRYLVAEYRGPHIDTVLMAKLQPEKSWEKHTATSWLHMAIVKENWKAILVLLEVGADPTFPSLPCDAATAMRSTIREHPFLVSSSREIEQSLEIIRMLERQCQKNKDLPEPTYEELCCRQADTIASQGHAWTRQLQELVECRQEIPYRRSQQGSAQVSTPVATIEYRPLANESSFRLLDLLPSTNRSAPLRARLVYSDITFRPDYEALSYVWGSAIYSKNIVVDGKTVTVTRNLYSALSHIRHPKDTRRLWVDALCIDQSKDKERNQQVTIMGDIYKSARQVIIWLGEAADDSHLVFEHLKGPECYADAKIPRVLQAWNALITRPWFFRTWVIQEVVLSRKAVIMCGEDSAPWNSDHDWDREISSDITGDANGLSRPRHSASNWVDDPLSGFEADSHIGKLGLLSVLNDPASILQYSRVCQTSEPRDRVYGILGLLKPGFLTVDYKLPIEQIFHQFTKASIQSMGNLNVLRCFGIGAPSELGSLQSWVPDFTCTAIVGTLPSRFWRPPDGTPKTLTFREGDGTTSSIPSEGLTSKVLNGLSFQDNGTLLIKGKRVDTIRALGPELPAETECRPGTKAFAQVIEAWELLAASLCHGGEGVWGASVTKTFADTLAASYEREVYSIDIGFTHWYRHCGTGVLEKSDPAMFLRNIELYSWWLAVGNVNEDDDPLARDHHLDMFSKAMLRSCYGRRFFITDGGSMGLAGPRANPGDQVVFLPGADMPFVLRRQEDGTGWVMVSDCYLYGLDPYGLFQNDEHLVEDFVVF